MSFGLGGLGLDKELGTIMNANRANPTALRSKIKREQKMGVTPQLLEVLASQKLLKEKQTAKNALLASQESMPGTIAEQQDAALKQMAVADLQKEADVARSAGLANQLAMLKQKKNINRIQNRGLPAGAKVGMPTGAPMGATASPPTRTPMGATASLPTGIAGAPVPRPMKAAQGGIVGFADGNQVESDNPGLLSTIWDIIQENPGRAAAVGILSIPVIKKLWQMSKGIKAAPGLVEKGLGGVGSFIKKHPYGSSAVGAIAAEELYDQLVEPEPVIPLEEIVQKPPLEDPYDEKPIPEPPEAPAPEPDVDSIFTPPELQRQAEYEPDHMGNLATLLSSFRGGNPAAVNEALDKKDWQRAQKIIESNIAIDQKNIDNLFATADLRYKYANLAETSKLNENIQLSRSIDGLYNRLQQAAGIRQKAEKEFDSSPAYRHLANAKRKAEAGLMEGTMSEEEARGAIAAYEQVKRGYLAPYQGIIDAIQTQLDILQSDIDPNRPPTVVNP